MFRVSSINKSILSDKNKMDWERYYQDQIIKSTNNRLNKVEDFTGNQTGGFIRSFGLLVGKQTTNFLKGLHSNYQRALGEYQKEEDVRN